jgi:tetratricopeptide (TPR) repeat protein
MRRKLDQKEILSTCMSKWKSRPGGSRSHRLPQKARDCVYKADTLIEKKRYAEALEILEPVAAKYSNQPEILAAQAMCYLHLGYVRECLRAGLKLQRMFPDNPKGLMAAVAAYLADDRLALARRACLRFIERWPDERDSEYARTVAQATEAELERTLPGIDLPLEERYEAAELHEESQVLMEQGQIAQAREVAGRLLERLPNFIPAINNLSQIYYLDNRPADAIATAERALQIDPADFHALGNLARYLFLQGRDHEARRVADRLRSTQSDRNSIWIKKAETFSFLGDDQAVLDAFEGARDAGALKNSLNLEMLYHLAAVASWRLGGKEQARELWRQCLETSPGFEFARANLVDLSRPEGERNGPWAFTLNYLMRREVMDEMLEEFRKASKRNKTDIDSTMRNYARRHPEITHLIPYLLERGDPLGRDFAIKLASAIETPATLAALRDFALSQQGSDQARMEASHAAARAGLLPSGVSMRVWIKGEWRDILMFGAEISLEPEEKDILPPKVARLADDAVKEVIYGDPAKGERLLKQAIEIAPDIPALHNNLMTAYDKQGKAVEAYNLFAEIRRRFPEYLFGITSEAIRLARDGKPDEAEKALDPLLQRKRLRPTEFTSLCSAKIEVAIARRNREAAQSWIQIWESVLPNDPSLERHRSWVERTL